MDSVIHLFDRLNFTPFNTILLVALGFFLRSWIKGIMDRLSALDGPKGRVASVERRNTKQNFAIRRLEQRLDLDPIPEDDEGYL